MDGSLRKQSKQFCGSSLVIRNGGLNDENQKKKLTKARTES